jgi:hypothetical protein
MSNEQQHLDNDLCGCLLAVRMFHCLISAVRLQGLVHRYLNCYLFFRFHIFFHNLFESVHVSLLLDKIDYLECSSLFSHVFTGKICPAHDDDGCGPFQKWLDSHADNQSQVVYEWHVEVI